MLDQVAGAETNTGHNEVAMVTDSLKSWYGTLFDADSREQVAGINSLLVAIEGLQALRDSGRLVEVRFSGATPTRYETTIIPRLNADGATVPYVVHSEFSRFGASEPLLLTRLPEEPYDHCPIGFLGDEKYLISFEELAKSLAEEKARLEVVEL